MKATDEAASRAPSVARRCVALLLAVSPGAPLAGCGDYDPPARDAAGGSGQTTATGQLAGGGQPAAGGSNSAAGASSSAAGGMGAGAGGAAAGGMGAAAVEVAPVEASCEAVAPCGGDVVGSWVVAGSCLPVSGDADVSGFGLGCSAAPVTGALEVDGTWTANADGTFTDQTTTTGESQLELPAECLNVSGTITTCDRLGGALQALGYAAVTCLDAPSGGCTCSATAEQTGGLGLLALGAASEGAYTAAANVVTTSAGSSNNAYSYCVSGNALVMTPQATGATGALTGTIVLVKP